MNYKYLMPILLLTILCLSSQAAKYDPGIKLKAVQAKAISVAMQAFLKDEPSASLDHYSVSIRQWREYPTSEPTGNFEVIFGPDPDPDEVATGIYLSRGGRTVYGREIHYIISKDAFEVLKRLLAK